MLHQETNAPENHIEGVFGNKPR